MRLTITRTSPSNSEGPVTLRLTGPLDAHTRYALLDDAMTALLISRALTIDASEVDLGDGGVMALAEVRRLAEREGGSLEITNLPPEVRDALEQIEFEDEVDDLGEEVAT